MQNYLTILLNGEIFLYFLLIIFELEALLYGHKCKQILFLSKSVGEKDLEFEDPPFSYCQFWPDLSSMFQIRTHNSDE